MSHSSPEVTARTVYKEMTSTCISYTLNGPLNYLHWLLSTTLFYHIYFYHNLSSCSLLIYFVLLFLTCNLSPSCLSSSLLYLAPCQSWFLQLVTQNLIFSSITFDAKFLQFFWNYFFNNNWKVLCKIYCKLVYILFEVWFYKTLSCRFEISIWMIFYA